MSARNEDSTLQRRASAPHRTPTSASPLPRAGDLRRREGDDDNDDSGGSGNRRRVMRLDSPANTDVMDLVQDVMPRLNGVNRRVEHLQASLYLLIRFMAALGTYVGMKIPEYLITNTEIRNEINMRNDIPEDLLLEKLLTKKGQHPCGLHANAFHLQTNQVV